MTAVKLLPLVLMGIDMWAGIIYGITGDYKHMVYWFAAATLTACVTF